MSIREEYEAYFRARAEVAADPKGTIWLDQEARYVPPFQIYGPVWYVGDSWVCVHLVDTGDGLLLIDSGNCGATGMLIQSIWEAGFNPRNVRWIIHSHGHMDHIGGALFFKRMFGTQLLLGKPDAEMYRKRPELSYIQHAHNPLDALFTPDVEIEDNSDLTFGGITLRFYTVPGHTEGCVALFFDAEGSEGMKRFGYYGGFGFNTLQKDYLIEIGDPEYRMRQIYLESLAKVRDERVDVFLGNHCVNNDTLGRRREQLEHPEGPNPFLDSGAWGKYLDEKRDALLALMADPMNN